jgi:hypothetical protein
MPEARVRKMTALPAWCKVIVTGVEEEIVEVQVMVNGEPDVTTLLAMGRITEKERPENRVNR